VNQTSKQATSNEKNMVSCLFLLAMLTNNDYNCNSTNNDITQFICHNFEHISYIKP